MVNASAQSNMKALVPHSVDYVLNSRKTFNVDINNVEIPYFKDIVDSTWFVDP